MGYPQKLCLIISHLDASGKQLDNTNLSKYPNKFDIKKNIFFQTLLRFNIEFVFCQLSVFHTIIYPGGLTDKGMYKLKFLDHCRIIELEGRV